MNYKESKGIALLEVSGESCANCFTLLPIAKEIAQERNLSFFHIEAEQKTMEELQNLEIERIPTLLLLNDGKPFARCTGYQPQEILEIWIDAKIEEENKKIAHTIPCKNF